MTATNWGKISRFVSLSLLCFVGCGNDQRAAPPIVSEDGGEEDAAKAQDSGRDAAEQDGDSAIAQDDGGKTPSYQFGEDDWFEVDISYTDRFYDHRGFDVGVGATDFVVAFEYKERFSECGSRIDRVHIPASGEIPKAEIAVAVDLPTCSVATEPALLAQNGVYRALYSDLRSGRAELYSATLGASEPPMSMTDTSSIEQHAATTTVDSRTLAAWVTEDTATGRHAIYTRLLDEQNSQAVAVVNEEAGRMPQDLVLTHVGTRKAILGWVDLNEATRGIFVQRLFSDGTADGEPQQVLSDARHAYSGSTLDLAGSETGGAAVYSVDISGTKQVKFLRIDAEGRIKPETELKIVAPPRGQGKDASLVKWGSLQSNQYFVAFRAMPGENLTNPQIRTTSIDLGVPWDANKINYSEVASAATDGGRLTVRVTNDGTALLTWVDTVLSSKKTLRVLRLRTGD